MSRKNAMAVTPEFRIISLVPSLTDLCFSLGLGHYVVGRTDYCISPADKIGAITSVGGPQSVNSDTFKNLKPTHVLISPEENKRDIIPLINSCSAKPVLVHPKRIEDNLEIFKQFAKIFDCHKTAKNLGIKLNDALISAQSCKAETINLCALPLIWKNPWITVSSHTYCAAVLKSIGMTVPKLQDEALYPKIENLASITPRPDAIILTTEPYLFNTEHCAEVRRMSGCPHVYILAGESLAWYGSHAITAIEELIEFKKRILADLS